MLLPVIAAVAVVAVFVAVAYLRRWQWTGFTASSRAEDLEQASSKTLWDWLQLLIIPLALAAVGFALNAAQSNREQRREDERAARERALTDERTREDALRVYFDRMSELLLERDLRRSNSSSGSRALARTLTLTVLRRLDGRRKGFIVLFLAEAGLIDIKSPKVSFDDADLRGTILRDAGLFELQLGGADWQGADFRNARFLATVFNNADLRRADFRGAELIPVLRRAPFQEADLRHADFRGTVAAETGFNYACLTGTRFNGANLERADFTGTRGYGVDFSDSRLVRTRFRRAALAKVKIDGASTDGTTFPKAWGSDGLALSRDDPKLSCP